MNPDTMKLYREYTENAQAAQGALLTLFASGDAPAALQALEEETYWLNKADAVILAAQVSHDPDKIQQSRDRIETDMAPLTRRLEAQSRARNAVAWAEQKRGLSLKLESALAAQRLIQGNFGPAPKPRPLARPRTRTWGPTDVAMGDFVLIGRVLYEVIGTNAKSVGAPSASGAPAWGVYRAKDNPYPWTDRFDYTSIQGHATAAQIQQYTNRRA